MGLSIKELEARLKAIETEVEINQRRRREEAVKAKKALETITTEDAEMLSSIAPALPLIIKFSVEEIQANTNGEIETISQVTEQLRSYLEKRLEYYESRL